MDRKKLIILLLTIVCVSVATSKSAWISSVAICMFVLSSPSVVDATGECSRLDCPCASKWTKRREPESDIPQSARDTRNRTRHLLERLASERFRNSEHVKSLEACVQNREQGCLDRHLNRQCLLEGLPLFQQIQNVSRFDETSVLSIVIVNYKFVLNPKSKFQDFMRESQQLLSSLAVYVQQAREDEVRRVTDPIRILADDIKRIEDDGIYRILCSLRVGALYRDMPWEATNVSRIMPLGCKTFDTQAPIDNRNYMVFYTLEKLLDQIVGLSRRKRNGWVVSDPLQMSVYRHSAAGSDESDGNGGGDSVDDSKDGIAAQKYLQESKANYDEN